MKNSNRFTLDFIGILAILSIVAASFALVWFRENNPNRIRGSIFNENDDGATIFYNWAAQQQHRPEHISVLSSLYRYPQETIFILNTKGEYTFDEVIALDVWVQDGGTAVIALETNQASDITEQFGANISWIWPGTNKAQPKLPLLNWPNTITEPQLKANHKVNINCRQGVAIHIGSCRRPILASFGHGQGQIYLISTVHIFTNAGLQNEQNARLVENIVLNTAGRNGKLLFDEGHREQSFFWFINHPVGWAIFLILLLGLLYIFWRFTQPKPEPEEAIQAAPLSEIQESVQYLNKVAQADKSTHGPKAAKTHYWLRLKRTLSQRFRLDPTVSDEQFLNEIKSFLPEVDTAELISLHIRKERDPLEDDLALRTWTESMIQLTEKYQTATREEYY